MTGLERLSTEAGARDSQPERLPLAMTVDLEDWYHSMFQIPQSEWHSCEDRVLPATETLLALLDEYNVKATFFVLGEVAERHKQIVRLIASAGHEIGCHGYAHQLVHTQTPSEFEQDVRRALAVLEDQSGERVRGYRAAYWSITSDCLWAFDVLAQAGFDYDSSVYPTKTPIYGIPEAPLVPSRVRTLSGNVITEFPPAVLRLPGRNLPFAGGLYLRLFPLWLAAWGLDRLLRLGRAPLVYVHPPEFDPEKPRVPLSPAHRVLHYANLRSMGQKIPALLSRFEFAPVVEVLARYRQRTELADWTPC